jgi:hypothetical protein
MSCGCITSSKTAFKVIQKKYTESKCRLYTIHLKEELAYWRNILKRVVATIHAGTFTV